MKGKVKHKKPKLIANLGDTTPMDYGGFFVYEDGRCVKFEEPYEYKRENGEADVWIAYSFDADKCTYINGILSDNEFHPDYPTWFSGDIKSICSSMDVAEEVLIGWFCSDNIIERAQAWRCVGDHWGFDNLDNYPTPYTRGKVYRYFRKECYWRFRDKSLPQ